MMYGMPITVIINALNVGTIVSFSLQEQNILRAFVIFIFYFFVNSALKLGKRLQFISI